MKVRILLTACAAMLILVPLNALPADLLGLGPGLWAIAAAVPGLAFVRRNTGFLAGFFCIAAAIAIGSVLGNGTGPAQTLGLLVIALGCFSSGRMLHTADIRLLAALVLAVGLLDLAVELISGDRFWIRLFSPTGGQYDRGIDSRVRGVLGHPVPSAVLTASCGAYLVSLLKQTDLRIWRVGLFVSVTTVIFFTGTRSALLLWVIFVVIIAGRPNGRRTSKAVRALATAVALTAVVAVATNQTNVGSDSDIRALQITLSDDDNAFVNRRDYSTEFLSQIADCPRCLAFGDGQYGLILSNREVRGIEGSYGPDNAVLTTIYDYGIGGVLLLGFLVSLLFKPRTHTSIEVHALRIAFGLSLASWLVFDGQYFFGTLAWTLILGGRIHASSSQADVEDVTRRAVSSR